LLNRRVANCTVRTVQTHEANLGRFLQATGDILLDDISALTVQRYLAALRERVKPITAHQHFACLRAFFAWCVAAALLQPVR
jgi:site-specific recombinase XerD